MFRFLCLILLIFVGLNSLQAQELPIYLSQDEKPLMQSYLSSRMARGITTPPEIPVRNMAEWEEIQSLIITWRSYKEELAQIVDHAQEECLVIINCTDSVAAKTELQGYGIPLDNVQFHQVATNSVWIRDYGPNSVYYNEVDSLAIVDWIYNRPRPEDDALPARLAELLDLPLYETSQNPYALVHTGGNFMSDGLGTAFSEKLILDENTDIGEAGVDTIMKQFMGIKRYVKIENLPNDGIHHIDMHMKLLDEQTLLVGEFPAGIADYEQIEANLQYIMANFNSVFGTPYRVIRVPMPPSISGNFPPVGYYRTYSNGIFVNKTYLYPSYYEQYDTIAHRILVENLPGYKVIPINSQQIIGASGAIHCISHSIGVEDPLLIVHQPFEYPESELNEYSINAKIRHRSGIQNARVHYKTQNDSVFSSLPMTMSNASENVFTANIPQQNAYDTVSYYIEAESVSGKILQRPITAPEGFWNFSIPEFIASGEIPEQAGFTMHPAFPNPGKSIIAIPLECAQQRNIQLDLYNLSGQFVQNIFRGPIPQGKSHQFLKANDLSSGIYLIRLLSEDQVYWQKIMVR